jgi:ABC-type transport system involved in Fe-S cluster assembly fused permease/ATPase subunit
MDAKEQPSLHFFLRFLRPYTGLIAITSVFLLLGQVAASLEPVWLKYIVNDVTGHSPLHAILVVTAIYFGLRFLDFFFDSLRDIVFAPAEMGIGRTLSRELFAHLLSLPVSYHGEQRLGAASRKITRGSRAIQFILDYMVGNIVPTIVQLIVSTIILLKLYKPEFGLIIFGTIVAYTVFTLLATQKRQQYRLAANKADDEVGGVETDALGNIETVKYFNAEDELLSRHRPLVDQRYTLQVRSNQIFALVEGGQGLILLLGLGTVLLLAIRQTVNHTFNVGDLVLLTTYIGQLSAPIGSLGFVYRQIKDNLADINGMLQMLQEEASVVEPAKPIPLPQPHGDVRFDQVSFTYANKRPVLKGVTLDIKPGQKVAFVGHSGAGKSTIVKLLFRLYDPTGGKIKIDGIPLSELSKSTRRDIFAIVPQEPVLFNTTVSENIRFAKPNATNAEIQAACRVAAIDGLIESLPEKYETVVGERGVKLSGGEKQRVAIARAVIRDPKVLVFDEATSSLDSTSERQILGALDAAAAGRTTIAIAHRLSTVVDSDRIYVLDKGSVVESGTHGELLHNEGRYADLWNLQVRPGAS